MFGFLDPAVVSRANGLKVGEVLLQGRLGSEDTVWHAAPRRTMQGGKSLDDGYWSVPKGEIEPGEDLLAAAIREFKEETGVTPRGEFIELGAIKQKGGKIVHAWAFSGDWDGSQPLKSNTFELEWPPGSGSVQSFPEIDRVGFFSMPEAFKKLKESQHPFLDRLQAALKDRQNL